MTATTAPPPVRRNAFGVASLAVAAASVLLAAAVTVGQSALIGASSDLSVYTLVQSVRGVVNGLLAVVAVVLGIVGLAGRSPRKALAAAGTAVGAAQLVDIVSGLLFGLLVGLR